MNKSTETVKMRLILDVTYVPNGCAREQLAAMLEQVAHRAAQAAQLSGDTPAKVDGWDCTVAVVEDPPKGLREWLLQAVEDGAITLDVDSLLHWSYASPGSANAEWTERMQIDREESLDDFAFAVSEAFPEERGGELVSWLKENPGAASEDQIHSAIADGIEAIVTMLADQRRESVLAQYLDAESLARIAKEYARFDIGPQPE